MAKPLNEIIRHIYVETTDGVASMLDHASDSLADIVKAVDAHNKAGSLTLKIDVRPSTAGAMAVKGTITMKKPQGLPKEALLWPTPEGNLVVDDPKQTKLELKQVSTDKPPLKSIEPAA